MYYKVVLITAT